MLVMIRVIRGLQPLRGREVVVEEYYQYLRAARYENLSSLNGSPTSHVWYGFEPMEFINTLKMYLHDTVVTQERTPL